MAKMSIPRQWKFGSIPEEILNSTLSIYSKVLIGAITYHAFDDGESWPGQARLSKMCSCSVASIHRATKELEMAGYLRVTLRNGTTSKYQFLSKESPIPQIAVESKPLSHRQGKAKKPYLVDGTPLSHRRTNETNKLNLDFNETLGFKKINGEIIKIHSEIDDLEATLRKNLSDEKRSEVKAQIKLLYRRLEA